MIRWVGDLQIRETIKWNNEYLVWHYCAVGPKLGEDRRGYVWRSFHDKGPEDDPDMYEKLRAKAFASLKKSYEAEVDYE